MNEKTWKEIQELLTVITEYMQGSRRCVPTLAGWEAKTIHIISGISILTECYKAHVPLLKEKHTYIFSFH